MFNTLPQTCRAQTDEPECWYSAEFLLVPFSYFHLVRENVYPAALLLIRGHCPQRSSRDRNRERKVVMFHHTDSQSVKLRHSYNWLVLELKNKNLNVLIEPASATHRVLCNTKCVFVFRDAQNLSLSQTSKKNSQRSYWSKNIPNARATRNDLVIFQHVQETSVSKKHTLKKKLLFFV